MHGIVNCFSQSLLFTHCCLILAILLLCGVDEVELLCITVLSLVTLVFQNIVIKLQNLLCPRHSNKQNSNTLSTHWMHCLL